jgi:UDP-glucose:(heptosyl)LPS alpha-1,3-glucosyltransferase
MKIAFIVRTYAKYGGICGYVTALAERLSKDHEVHIFAATWQDVKSEKIIFHKVPILSFEFMKTRKYFALNNAFEIASFALISVFYVNYKEFDIVHAQGNYFGRMDITTAHSCHKAWLKVFNRTNTSIIERLKKSVVNPLHILLLFAEKHCFNSAKKVVAVSKGVRNEIIKYYEISEKKIVAIPNGVDIDLFNPENRDVYRKEIRNKYNIKNDEIVIMFPAHEFVRKGLWQILEAVSILKEKKICVLAVGRDKNDPFKKIIDETKIRAIFTGAVENINRYYAASDIFVFPTMYEAFSLATLEAVASGLPAIVTKVNGTDELIRDGYNGFFVGRDGKEIAETIRLLIDDGVLMQKLGKGARESAEKFTWDIIVRNTYDVYEEVLKNKNRDC